MTGLLCRLGVHWRPRRRTWNGELERICTRCGARWVRLAKRWVRL